MLITGAGASRELGLGEPMPLMKDWSTALVRALAQAPSSGLVQLTGLSPEMDGMEFEQRLGRFLVDRAAFSQVRDITAATKTLQLAHQLLNAEGVLDGWWSTTEWHLEQAVNVIRGSLYELFGEARLDLGKAEEAYGGLLQMLRIGKGTHWVYATTNYDAFGEITLNRLGIRVDWGEPAQARSGSDRPVDVEGLVAGLARYTPVLHLHGRLGWYRRTDGVGPIGPYAIATTKHDPGYGTPIVVLPNPDKPYESDDVISSLWRQLAGALGRAKRVLVLGHSLNDDAIVQALTDNVEPLERVAVSLLASANTWDEIDPSAQSLLEILRTRLPSAAMIPIRFGESPDSGKPALDKWFARLNDVGLL